MSDAAPPHLDDEFILHVAFVQHMTSCAEETAAEAVLKVNSGLFNRCSPELQTRYAGKPLGDDVAGRFNAACDEAAAAGHRGDDVHLAVAEKHGPRLVANAAELRQKARAAASHARAVLRPGQPSTGFEQWRADRLAEFQPAQNESLPAAGGQQS